MSYLGFGAADLITQIVLEEGLENLRKNPHHLEFILGVYSNIPSIKKKVGPEYISNAIQFILNSKIWIKPYYVPDQDQYPRIDIAASYAESNTYFGDYAGKPSDPGLLGQFTIAPEVYAAFDILKISKDNVEVSEKLSLQDKIPTGMTIRNGSKCAKVVGWVVANGKNTKILLDTDLSGSPMKGWKAMSLEKKKTANINASHDQVTIQCKLTTSGDPDLHRILGQVVRYCLKKGRKRMDDLGIQNISMQQTPPVIQGSDALEFIGETVFTVTGTMLDAWIGEEADQVDNMDMDVFAISEAEGNSPVPLE